MAPDAFVCTWLALLGNGFLSFVAWVVAGVGCVDTVVDALLGLSRLLEGFCGLMSWVVAPRSKSKDACFAVSVS
ncbi:hypothetical protein N658DRAFT_496362 [Parathielavia hyrcaniae]|uniref:Uncharacterized protein n=1 Tax=Parathielavia hyrcaniae TaxID=113614 RepID=A0AAN6Q0Y7_9PEZI|nr:hypothetical protein N658DRAFT_496362 [Parathielavia hyrcaniae]